MIDREWAVVRFTGLGQRHAVPLVPLAELRIEVTACS